MQVLNCMFAVLLASCLVLAEDKDKDVKSKDDDRPKIFKRLIPADVLRDFPGVCFASTRCSTIEPGHSWELAPFCGRSTCVLDKDPAAAATAEEGRGEPALRLLELVEDCGPLPKANPKCKLSEKTNKTAPFPSCCPIFDCEEGVKLEYPEVPVPAPAAEKPKA